MTDCPSYDRDPEQPDRCLVDAFEPAAKGADEPFMILGNNAVPYSFEGIVFYTFRDASYFSRPHHGFDDFPDSVRDKYFDQLIPKVENLLESPIPLLEQQEKLQSAVDAAIAKSTQRHLDREAELVQFFKDEGLKVYEPDRIAFRDYAQKKYLESDFAKSWPDGMIEAINALSK